MLRRTLGITFLSAMVGIASSFASVVPAGAESAADVNLVCSRYGTTKLPPGPPSANGLITIVVRGQTITTTYVPGPCSVPAVQAPG